jgi:hypothetical protein
MKPKERAIYVDYIVNVNSWKDTLKHHVKAFTGFLYGTVGHPEPLSPDHTFAANALISLNRRGVFTFDGPGSVCDKDTTQRSYVDFFVSKFY